MLLNVTFSAALRSQSVGRWYVIMSSYVLDGVVTLVRQSRCTRGSSTLRTKLDEHVDQLYFLWRSLFAPFFPFFVVSSPAQYCEWMRCDLVSVLSQHDGFNVWLMCFLVHRFVFYCHYVLIHALIPSYLSDTRTTAKLRFLIKRELNLSCKYWSFSIMTN